jgi:hypothetical protein
LQLGQAFLPLPGQHSNLISVLRGRFSIQADTLERLQERDESLTKKKKKKNSWK